MHADDVGDVVADHGREPADLLARLRDVVGDLARRAHQAAQRGRVAPRLLGRAPRRGHRPLDDRRVGELDDHAVADAPRDAERARAVRRPRTAGSPACPAPTGAGSPCPPSPPGRPFMKSLIIAQRCFELGDRRRLAAHHAHRAVAAADPHHHAAVGDVLQRRVGARGHGRLAGHRVGDAHADPHPLGLVGQQRDQRVRLLPQDRGVVGPAGVEAERLGLDDQLDQPLVGRVGQDGDAEVQHQRRPARGSPPARRPSA